MQYNSTHSIILSPPQLHDVQPILRNLTLKKYNTQQIITFLKYFAKKSNVPSFLQNKRIDFLMLKIYYEKQVPDLYASIAQEVLNYKGPAIRYLYAGKMAELNLKKQQVAYLICLMALMLVPAQKRSHRFNFHEFYDFRYVFSDVKFKTISIMKYLQLYFCNKKAQADQILTIKRKFSPFILADILSENKKTRMSPLVIHDNSKDIQSNYGTLKVDFANSYVGGGSLYTSAVQEQIMFSNHPQMYVSILLCEALNEDQAIQFVGFKKYFCTKGYGQTAEFFGENTHQYQYDDSRRAIENIVAIDSLDYREVKRSQFDRKCIDREILKAYVGFSMSKCREVTTGNWGCGKFGSDAALKLMIQWIAASLANKQLHYCPFGIKQMLMHCTKEQKETVLSVYLNLNKPKEKQSGFFDCFKGK